MTLYVQHIKKQAVNLWLLFLGYLIICSVGVVQLQLGIHSNNEFPLNVACIFLDLECSEHIVTISTGISHRNRSLLLKLLLVFWT